MNEIKSILLNDVEVAFIKAQFKDLKRSACTAKAILNNDNYIYKIIEAISKVIDNIDYKLEKQILLGKEIK